MSETANSFKRVAVVGGCGGFGVVFTRALRRSGADVVTVDVDGGASVQCDVTSDATPLIALLPECDVLLLCVPEPVVLAALEKLDGNTPKDLLVVDICSVKTNVVAAAQRFCQSSQYLSVHPMFGPERRFEGNAIVAIDVRGGDLSERFVDTLSDWRLRVIPTDSATHDQVTSVVQVLTHAALLTFAEARGRIDAPAELVEAMATPIFREIARVTQGMLGENPELYHNIQTANPGGAVARQALLDAVESVVAEIDGQRPERMTALFERLRRPES